METPTTLIEAITYFSDPERAFQFAVKLLWPNGIVCPRMGCGSAGVQFLATRKMWRCKDCKRQFSVRVGTIFEDSPISFTKWLPAIWLLSNTKNGTSSWELSRALGVTQKKAFTSHQRSGGAGRRRNRGHGAANYAARAGHRSGSHAVGSSR